MNIFQTMSEEGVVYLMKIYKLVLNNFIITFVIYIIVLLLIKRKTYSSSTIMPPIPVDCSEYPRIKSSRTKLNFTVEKREMNDLCREDGKPSVMSCDMNILVDENSQKYMNGVSGHNKRFSPFSESTPSQKRPRYNFYTSTPKSNILSTPKKTTKPNFFTSTPKPILKESSDSGNRSPVSAIIEAVDRLSTKADVTADGSRDNTLPTIPGKHRDLKSIKPETMSDVLDGAYNDIMDSLTVIDCRYPYEFDGGHIKGAINLYTKDMIEKFLKETRVTPNKTQVIIFHCEFSSERGPKMFRFLRSLDREINKDNYPRLNFPEVYLLEGGYKAFFYQNKEQCYPQTYKPMLHKDHKDDLRHFRVKSKSWSAGEKSRPRHSLGSGMRLRF